MSIWAEFNPLKSCVIGTLPKSDDIIPYTNLRGRYKNYFINIIDKSRQELDNLDKLLQEFGVKTWRSSCDFAIHNGYTINTPPLAIRDTHTIYGNSLFKGNVSGEYELGLLNSCDQILQQINFDKTYKLTTDNIFYEGDWNAFNAEELCRPLYHPTLSLKCGNDIIISRYFGREGNKLGNDEYITWIKSVNPSARIHFIEAESHLDSQLFLVRPGLLITSLQTELPTFFKNWEKIIIEKSKSPRWGNPSIPKSSIHEHRHKKFHPVLAQWFHNFLQTCTEETFFSLNSLSINEETVLFTGTNVDLFDKLEKRGITCVSVDMRATTFWDTGVHCVTNEVEREGILENYIF